MEQRELEKLLLVFSDFIQDFEYEIKKTFPGFVFDIIVKPELAPSEFDELTRILIEVRFFRTFYTEILTNLQSTFLKYTPDREEYCKFLVKHISFELSRYAILN